MEKEIVRVNRREILGGRAGISYMQILILVISSFAVAWMIGSIDAIKPVQALDVINCCPENKLGAKCTEYASSTCASQCSTLPGKTCQPMKCDQLTDCKLGCCYDSVQGTCAMNSPKGTCETNGGLWKPSESCNPSSVPQCKQGCCVYNGNSAFTTEQQCRVLSGNSVNSLDFRIGITNELDCLALGGSSEKGACLLNDGSCRMTTSQNCISLTGKNIRKGLLCTSPSLNSSCRKTENTACTGVLGQDEVYYLDSCGNFANIYDASRYNDAAYWDRVVAKLDSCGANDLQASANSKTCGNCNYVYGSRCRNYMQANSTQPEKGSNICQNLNCKKAPSLVDAFGKVLETKDRMNGESWCVYDGTIGNGNDIVGSRHFKYSCTEGEVKVEPCADFRNEVCEEKNQFNVDGKTINFANAACIVNDWQSCINANSEKNNSNICKNDSVSCFNKYVNVGGSFNFNICLPQYPEGFDTKESSDSAKTICGMATRKCVIQYKATMTGGCKCVDNCQCDKATFTTQMGDVCRSLGDCGLEVNIAGEETDNYKVSGAPKLAADYIAKIEAMATPVAGQHAEITNISEYLEKTGLAQKGSGSGGSGIDGMALGAGALGVGMLLKMMGGGGIGGILGGGGSSAAAAAASSSAGGSTVPAFFQSWNFAEGTNTVQSATVVIGDNPVIVAKDVLPSTNMGGTLGANPNFNIPSTTPILDEAGVPTGQTAGSIPGAIPETTTGATPATTGTAALGNALVAMGIGMLIGSMLAKALKLSPQGSMLMTIGGGLIGLGLQGMQGLGVLTSLAPVFLMVGIVMVIIAIFMVAKKCKPKTVEFTCNPWQPPSGGSQCEKCGLDPLKPCSKYRCESLGAACKIVNEGTKREACIQTGTDDKKAPVITPWYEILNGSQYAYTEVGERGFKVRELDGSCIQAFTPLTIGIKTDESAQCKMSLVSTSNLDAMDDYFGDSNYYLKEHQMGFSMPNVDSALAEINESINSSVYKYVLDTIGNPKFFIRCQDSFGNYNAAEYMIDVCVKPGPDRTAPIITSADPTNGASIAYNKTSQDVSVFVNEPATCRYSRQDKNYSAMENGMSCQTSMLAGELSCATTLTNLSRGDNTYYFKCSDQPIFAGTINESQRNQNSQSYTYNLKVSENPLIINSIEPNGTFTYGAEPIESDLRVSTSGGSDSGQSLCYYSFTGDDADYILFSSDFGTLNTNHLQVFSQMTRGDYDLYVKCQDDSGNTALGRTSLKLRVDLSAPIVTRVYSFQNALQLDTNEASECAYSNLRCNFMFNNGTQMSGGISNEHSADWNPGQSYYIKCRDAWGHEPSGCSVIVKAYKGDAT
jgi:hypothetical protein